MSQDLPVLLTVPEAARVLRVGRDLTYALAARREIPTIRLGRRILIPRDALLRWVEASDQGVAGPSVPLKSGPIGGRSDEEESTES